MPIVDMPLEELKVYQGRNPKPEGFDAYWDEALSEMRAVDPQVELVKAAFTAPGAACYDMYFTGVNGARIYAKCLKPAHSSGKMPAMLHFHGYTGASGDWTSYLPYVLAGFGVFALDCRGQGGKSGTWAVSWVIHIMDTLFAALTRKTRTSSCSATFSSTQHSLLKL